MRNRCAAVLALCGAVGMVWGALHFGASLTPYAGDGFNPVGALLAPTAGVVGALLGGLLGSLLPLRP